MAPVRVQILRASDPKGATFFEENTHTMRAQNTLSASPGLALDHRRFDSLVRSHYPVIYRFAHRLTGCHTNAEDLTQDTLLRAYRSLHTYDARRPFKQWVQRITYRLFLDRLRAQKLPEMLSLDTLQENTNGEAGALDIPDTRYEPERAMMEQTLDEHLERALADLPERFRAPILLCEFHDLSYEQIAATMNCTPGTVRSRIHRGRKILQQMLATGEKAPKRAARKPRACPVPVAA